MIRKPRRLSVFVVLSLALLLITALHTVPPALANYPYTIGKPMGDVTKADAIFTPPLQTAGRHIVDVDGKRLKLASINWYGASDIFFVPMGLDIRHRSEIAQTI
jgi:endoglucanase